MRNHQIRRNHVNLGTFAFNVWNARLKAYENVDLQVEVDASEIAKHLGPKAVISKARKSKSVHGAVIVTHVMRAKGGAS